MKKYSDKLKKMKIVLVILIPNEESEAEYYKIYRMKLQLNQLKIIINNKRI